LAEIGHGKDKAVQDGSEEAGSELSDEGSGRASADILAHLSTAPVATSSDRIASIQRRNQRLRQDYSNLLQLGGIDLGQTKSAHRCCEEPNAQPPFQRVYPAGQN
jgi:hypothetical protein